MGAVETHYFEFDAFRIEVEERRLLRNGAVVTLTPRTFDLLLTLVRNAGQTVDKEDLMEAVWQDTFVEEGNLNRHVSTLRRLLGDDPREQRLIKTIPKKGYRFTAKVTERLETVDSLAISQVSRGHLVIKEETIERFWSVRRAVVAAALFVAALAGAWVVIDRKANAKSPIRTESQAGLENARDLWRSRRAGDLHEATLALENIVQRDPDFALAHAALADAYAFDYANWKKTEASALKAIALDPTLGEPHASIGFVRMFWEWRLADAESELKTATQLSPSYATGHQWYALNLASRGSIDAAVVEIERAASLDPNSIAIMADRCQILYFANRYDEAVAQCTATLGRDPGNVSANETLYQIYMTVGRYDLAVEKFVDNVSHSSSSRTSVEAEHLRAAYARKDIQEFRRAQAKFYAAGPANYMLARVLAEGGDTEGAVTALREAVARREFDVVFFAPDPAFHAIRTGPRDVVIEGLPK